MNNVKWGLLLGLAIFALNCGMVYWELATHYWWGLPFNAGALVIIGKGLLTNLDSARIQGRIEGLQEAHSIILGKDDADRATLR